MAKQQSNRANFIITQAEKNILDEKRSQFDFGNYKSELEYVRDIAAFLHFGTSDILFDCLDKAVKQVPGFRIYVYQDGVPDENLIMSKGILEILTRRIRDESKSGRKDNSTISKT